MSKTRSSIKKIWLLGLMAGGLFALLLTTNPVSLPLAVLTLPFVLMYLCLYMLLVTVLTLFRLEMTRRIKFSIMLLSIVPVGLLVLQSAGQLSLRDAAILLIFCTGLLFYLERIELV